MRIKLICLLILIIEVGCSNYIDRTLKERTKADPIARIRYNQEKIIRTLQLLHGNDVFIRTDMLDFYEWFEQDWKEFKSREERNEPI